MRQTGEWLCTDYDPEMFFPEHEVRRGRPSKKFSRDSPETLIAKEICSRCSSVAQCLDEALEEGPENQLGIRAGMRSGEREALLANAADSKQPPLAS